MAVTKDIVYEGEFNCITTDIANSVPPLVDGDGNAFEESSIMFVWDETTTPKSLDSVFKMIFGVWHLLD